MAGSTEIGNRGNNKITSLEYVLVEYSFIEIHAESDVPWSIAFIKYSEELCWFKLNLAERIGIPITSLYTRTRKDKDTYLAVVAKWTKDKVW